MKPHNHFDLLRLLAAVGVMVTHAYAFVGLPEEDLLYQLTDSRLTFSRLALYTFFTISGFLVTQSLLRSSTLSSFVVKRILRIMPALIVVVALSVFVLGPLMSTLPSAQYFAEPQTWRYFFNITILDQPVGLPGVFENNPVKDFVNGSLWTLKYELICYLGLVLVALFVKSHRRLGAIFLTMVFCAALVFRAIYEAQIFEFVFPYFALTGRHFFVFGLMFLAGVVAALYREKIRFSLPVAALLIVAWFLVQTPVASALLTHIAIPYLVLTIGQKNSPLGAFTSRADFSYGLYIYAFPVTQIIIALTHITSMPVCLLISIFATAPFAIASWFFVEKPALSLKEKLAR